MKEPDCTVCKEKEGSVAVMKEMMKAAVLKEFGKPLVIEEIPVPHPGPGEVLIEVKGSGLCATDLHIRDGNIPTVKVPYVPGGYPHGISKLRGTYAQTKGMKGLNKARACAQ